VETNVTDWTVNPDGMVVGVVVVVGGDVVEVDVGAAVVVVVVDPVACPALLAGVLPPQAARRKAGTRTAPMASARVFMSLITP
jgi:hypothetical protein